MILMFKIWDFSRGSLKSESESSSDLLTLWLTGTILALNMFIHEFSCARVILNCFNTQKILVIITSKKFCLKMLLFWKSNFINYNKRKIQKTLIFIILDLIWKKYVSLADRIFLARPMVTVWHSQPVNRDGPNNLTWADPFVGKH